METDARIIAIRYYAGSRRCMGDDLAALGSHPEAVIIYLPQLVVLMRPVNSQRPETWERLRDKPPATDAWYVHFMAGDMKLARELAQQQKPRPWLCFRRGMRNCRPHVVSWQRFVSPRLSGNQSYRKNKKQWDS